MAQTHVCVRFVRVSRSQHIGVERGLATSRVECPGSRPGESKPKLSVKVSLDPRCCVALIVHAAYETN